MTLLEVWRVMSGPESTLGVLYRTTSSRRALCWTLEDQFQQAKVKGETRIPAGTYGLSLRTEGGFHARYAKRFGELHKGMLWIRGVPDFQYVLIHCGNDDGDTEGCVLVGDIASQNVSRPGHLGGSEEAYKRMYPPIAAALLAGEEIRIRFTDVDQPPGIP